MRAIILLFALTFTVQSCEYLNYIQDLVRNDICSALPSVQDDEYFTPVSILYTAGVNIDYLTPNTSEPYEVSVTGVVEGDLWAAFDSIGGKMTFMEDLLLPGTISGEDYITTCGDLLTYHYSEYKVVPMKTHRKKLPYFIEIKKTNSGYKSRGVFIIRKQTRG